MMSKTPEQRDQELGDAFLALARAVADALRSNGDTRRLVRTACEWLIEELADSDEPETASGEGEARASEAAVARDESVSPALQARAAAPSHGLAAGGMSVHQRDGQIARDPSSRRTTQYADFDTIIGRSRLKGEACRWKVEQRRLEEVNGDETQLSTTYDELIDRAKGFDNCYLWMLQWTSLPDDQTMRTIAACYDNLATAAEVCRDWSDGAEAGDKPSLEMLHLAAEAQSALREALLEAGFQDDRDQNDVFYWLREQADRYSIYIERHLRKSDPADPENWPDLKARIEGYAKSVGIVQSADRSRAVVLNKITYHVEHLDDPRFHDEQPHHWETIVACLDQWVDAGLDPADEELCRLIAPVADHVPADLERSAQAAEILERAGALTATCGSETSRPGG